MNLEILVMQFLNLIVIARLRLRYQILAKLELFNILEPFK